MSPNDDDPAEQKKKKYLWLGYGNYGSYGFSDPIHPQNIRADPGILDKLFEIFGVKEKTKEESQEDRK